MVQDLRIAFRLLTSKLGFSLMAVGMLALGIAGNAAIFSIFNGLFLRPLPFPRPERLVDLDETAPNWNLRYVGVSNPDFYAWRKENRTFESMGFFSGSSFNLSGYGQAQRVQGAQVTHDLLEAFDLKLVLGRNILPEEDRPGGAKVVLLSTGLWKRLFNQDRNVLGRILKLDNVAYTVIGVLPPEAAFPSDTDVWVPLAADTAKASGWYLNGVGRLKPGVPVEQARADLIRIHRAQIRAGREVNEITSPVVAPLRERYLGEFRAGARALLAAVAIVLLIACVNIAGLMMVRGAARSREIAIRTALGASRGKIVRQLLTESLLLAGAGGVFGVLLGSLCLRAMLSLVPEDMPRWINFSLDYRFLVFCVGITGAAAVLFGLVPAWQAARPDTRGPLMDTTPRSSLSQSRRRGLSALVVCEIALALVLLIGASLLMQAFRKVISVDPGFRPENVITYGISLPDSKYSAGQRPVFFDNLLAKLRALPGVKSAGAASAPPLGGHSGYFFVAEGGRQRGPKEQDPVVLQVAATPGYFDAIGVTFLSGRQFDGRDGDAKGPQVAIVNETFAKQFWPGVNPVGKRIRYSWVKDKWFEVVGITRDVKHYGLDQEMRPGVYVPYRQSTQNGMSIVVRGSVDPRALIAPARDVLRGLDADLPMFDVRTMTERLDRSLWARRGYSWLFGGFAVVALLLAAAGIYGVISYAVTQRTHEIGIRMALGARPVQVLRQVLWQGMALICAGVALGLLVMVWAAKALDSLLFGFSAHDAITYAAVVAGVVCVALLANLVPARRAAAVDPIRALRFE